MVDRVIVKCLTPLSTVFQLYHGGQCTYPCFPGVFFTSTTRNIPSKPALWLLSHITVVETTYRGDRGMKPVAVTIINPWNEYLYRPSRRSNQRPPVLYIFDGHYGQKCLTRYSWKSCVIF